MVEFISPTMGVQARQAGQVSSGTSQQLARAAGAAQTAAGTFTEFYEKEAAIQNDLLLATTQADWTQRYNDTQRGAGAGYAEVMLSDYDEYVRGIMVDAPQRGRDELQLAHDKYRLNLETKSLQREAAARAAAKAASIAEADRLKVNALISDPALLDGYMDGASQGQQEKYVNAALSGTMMFDPTTVNEDVMGGKWDAHLTPSQKLSFGKLSQSAMERIAREEATLRAAEVSAYERGFTEEVDFIAVNGAAPVDSNYTPENIDAMYEGDPEGAAEMKALVAQATMDAEAIHSVSSASPDELQVEFERLKADIDEYGNTRDDVTRMNAFSTAVSGRNENIINDGAGYLTQTSDVVSTAFDAYSNADPESRNVAASQLVDVQDAEYETLGVDAEFRTILPKQAALDIVAGFNDMGADVAPQALKEFKETWGDNSPRVMAELAKAGLAPEYVAAMRHSDNVGLSARIASMAGVDENDLKENLPTVTVTDTNREIIEEIADYQAAFVVGDSTGQAAMMFNQNAEIARKLTWKDVAQGMDPSDAVEKNFGQMFPEESINEQNVQLIVPVDVDARMLRISLEALQKPEALAGIGIVALDDPRLAELQDKEVAIEHLSRDGVWLNNSTGDGAVLHYNINGYLLPVTLENGDMFEKSFSEIPTRGQTQMEAFADIWPLK